MLRYFLALLLINTCSRSLGVPLPEGAANGSHLASLLEDLANRCENSFLSSQIKAKLSECDVTVPPYNEKEFECTIFYDINKQLCDSIAESKLALSGDYTSSINEAIDVESLCVQARNWTFKDIKEIPSYEDTVAQVFQARITCVKVCGVEDVISQDTNFFCKYYKWGAGILDRPSATVQTAHIVDNSEVTVFNMTSTKEGSRNPLTPTALGGNKINSFMTTRNAAVLNISKTIPNISKTVPIEEKQTLSKAEEPSKVPSTKPEDEQQSFPDKELNVDNVDVEESEKSPIDVDVKTSNSEKSSISPNMSDGNVGLDKPLAAEVETLKKQDENQANGNQIQESIDKDANASNKLLDQPDPDYQDSEEGKEGLADGDENGDDPMLGGDVANKLEETQMQTKTSKKIVPPLSFAGEREFFPHTMQDSYVDEDDHFFPLFLTAVVLVVLLYVLYHNKNKVSKLILGLLVEGRQPGRRRNSRGHAYRRLDTLEQAMSTNSAAPPSKIIY